MNTNIAQRVKFVAGAIAAGGNLHAGVSMPDLRFTRPRPSLYDRAGVRIRGWVPMPQLDASAPPPDRT